MSDQAEPPASEPVPRGDDPAAPPRRDEPVALPPVLVRRTAARSLLAPLADVDRQTLLAIFGGIFLLGVYVYQGHHSFFARHLGHRLLPLGHPFAEWAAHSYQFAAALLLLLVVPALWARLAWRQRLAACGLALGDVRYGLQVAALAALLLAGPLYLSAGSPDFQAEYPLAKIAGRSALLFLLWELCYLTYYIAWEFFFRGFWQLGLERRLGALGAMALQTSASTLLHIGKPEGETLAAVAAGIGFGLLALRTRSVLYVLLLHWSIGAMTDLFCLLRAG